MLGNHATSIRFVLAFNQSLYNSGDLSEFTLEQVIPLSNYFTRLSFERSLSFKDKIFKKAKYFDVMDWVAQQSRSLKNMKGLSLIFLSQDSDDMMMSGFVGGGKVICLQRHTVDSSSYYIYKANLARVTPPLRPKDRLSDQIVWDDAFIIAQPPANTSFGQPLAIEEASVKLNAALIEIENYALTDEYKQSWAPHFVNARNALEGRETEIPDYANFSDVCKHLSNDAQKLLNASSKAWVFGGMGSWNDGFGKGNYQEVTENLFNTLHECYVSVCAHSLDKTINR